MIEYMKKYTMTIAFWTMAYTCMALGLCCMIYHFTEIFKKRNKEKP